MVLIRVLFMDYYIVHCSIQLALYVINIITGCTAVQVSRGWWPGHQSGGDGGR